MRTFTLVAFLILVINSRTEAQMPPELVGYENWSRVTDKPVTVSSELWTLCIPPPPEWKAMNRGPHKGGAISVRVNEIGRKLFMNDQFPNFPAGTVIVKEKLLTSTDTKADSLGIMIKRTTGWEFAFKDTNGLTQGREKLASCYDCHAAMKSTDGVFRSYLSKQQNLAWNSSAANNQIHGMLRRGAPSHP